MPDLTEFAGLPVIEFPAKATDKGWLKRLQQIQESDAGPGPRFLAACAAWRLRMEYGEAEDYATYFARFLSEVDTEHVRALVIGNWLDATQENPDEVVELLAEHAEALPNLRSVFVGDIEAMESELSWINQGDMAPLLAAFPRLEELTTVGVGGEEGVLGLHVPSHASLRSLTVRTGGLPSSITREVISSGLPALEHLELWLGVEDYGGDTSPRDLAPVLSGERFPELRYLGVRNAEKADEWIPVLAEAPVTSRVDVLDLSLGVLTDEGGRMLIDRAAAFSGLRGLDLHHHFLSEEMVERVRAAFAGTGVEVDLSDRQEAHDYGHGPTYYTAASE